MEFAIRILIDRFFDGKAMVAILHSLTHSLTHSLLASLRGFKVISLYLRPESVEEGSSMGWVFLCLRSRRKGG